MKVSIIIIVYNEEKYIKKCLDSIFNQTFKKFELIIVNDGSTDKTSQIIKNYKHKIKFVQIKHSGYSSARNKGIKHAKGDLIFFTDADCIVDNNWIRDGVKYMDLHPKILAAGGKIRFEKDSIQMGPWITGCSAYKMYKYPSTMNCVYRISVLKKLNGFNKKYNTGGEDRDLGLRVLKLGKIGLSNMKITHRKKKIDWKRGLSLIKRHQNVVYMIKDHSKEFPKLRKSELCYGYILNPRYLLSIIFPPFLFYWLLKRKKNINIKDVLNIIPIYFGLILIRLIYWKTALKERIFLI
ncbi:glycosyltransferase family 2 protein [Candidatus Woesearchaeota archaeon]|jgi:glycosyltransferase involved in cell wall biosynthesis|nr:glycosyltransferase family 2 protein [Candidatus Woesearchaeota archaeon]